MSVEFNPIRPPIPDAGRPSGPISNDAPKGFPAVDPRGLGASVPPPASEKLTQFVTIHVGFGDQSAEPLRPPSSESPIPDGASELTETITPSSEGQIFPKPTADVPKPRVAADTNKSKDSPQGEPVEGKVDRRTLPKTPKQREDIGEGIRRHYREHPHHAKGVPLSDEHKAAISAARQEYEREHPDAARHHGPVSTIFVFPDRSEENLTHPPRPAAAIHELVTDLKTEIEAATGISAEANPHEYLTALAASVKGRVNGEMQMRVLAAIGGGDSTADQKARAALVAFNAKSILAAVENCMVEMDIPESRRDEITQIAITAVTDNAYGILTQARTEKKNRISTHVNNTVRKRFGR